MDAGRIPRKSSSQSNEEPLSYEPLPEQFVNCFQRALQEAGKVDPKWNEFYLTHPTTIRRHINHWRHKKRKQSNLMGANRYNILIKGILSLIICLHLVIKSLKNLFLKQWKHKKLFFYLF